MPCASRSNIAQRKRHTREPAQSLYDDVDDQPRGSGLSILNPAQRKKKLESAHQDFVTRRAVTTAAMLRKRGKQKCRDGEDDRIYTEVLMDLDEWPSGVDGGASDSDSDTPMSAQDADAWEDEEVTDEEESLLYLRAKGTINDLSVLLAESPSSFLIFISAVN